MVCNVSDGCGAAQGWWKLSALQISWSSLSLCWWLAGPLGNLQTSYCWVGRTNQVPVLVAVSQWGDSLGGPAPGCSLSRSSLQSDGVGGGEVTCNRPGVEISVITVITSDTHAITQSSARATAEPSMSSMSVMGTNKEFILRKYFDELQKYWATQQKLEGKHLTQRSD